MEYLHGFTAGRVCFLIDDCRHFLVSEFGKLYISRGRGAHHCKCRVGRLCTVPTQPFLDQKVEGTCLIIWMLNLEQCYFEYKIKSVSDLIHL